MNPYQKEVAYTEVISVEKQLAEPQESKCRAVIHPRDRSGSRTVKTSSIASRVTRPTYVLCEAQASWYVYVDGAEDMRVAICPRHKRIAEKGRLRVKTHR